MKIRLVVLSFVSFLASACSVITTATPLAIEPLPIPTPTIQPISSPIPTTDSMTRAPSISCAAWQSWPVVPSVSQTVRDIFQRGQTTGKNAQAFSKLGDGEVSAAWFLSAFDLGPQQYDLGPYQALSPVIEHFSGSFARIGTAAKRGFNTRRILDTSASLDVPCVAGESPLACELRLHRPAFAIVSLGTNQAWVPDEFESGLRQILDSLLAQDVVPILSTKGDNLEGDHRINHLITCLAQEYDLPLWNFWAAIQPLPNRGLQPDLEHLTYGTPDFDDKHAMQAAWTIRNLTALQVLDAVWRGVSP